MFVNNNPISLRFKHISNIIKPLLFVVAELIFNPIKVSDDYST